MLVNNATTSLVTINSISLKPGINTVNGAEWAVARKHPSIVKRIEAGLIVEESDMEENTNENVVLSEADLDHLKLLKVPQANALVKETFDLELLEGWSKKEDRNQVKGTLKKQIELLNEQPQLRDRSQSRQLDTGGEVQTVDLGHNLKGNANDD